MNLLHVNVTLVTERHEVEGRLSFNEPRDKDEIYEIISRLWREVALKIISLHLRCLAVQCVAFDFDQIQGHEKARLAFWKWFASNGAVPVYVAWHETEANPQLGMGGSNNGKA